MLRRILGLLCTALLTSCATATVEGDRVSLLISVSETGNEQSTSYQLHCAGSTPEDTSTLPNALKACEFLSKNSEALEQEIPPDQMCTEIYGGPETAEIKGNIGRKSIDTSLNRSNGCAIKRWDDLAVLLNE